MKPQAGLNQKVDDANSQRIHCTNSQSEEHPELTTRKLLEHCKTPHYLLQRGHSLEGIMLMWPLGLTKQSSYFVLHAKLVTMILLGITEQRLSFDSRCISEVLRF